MGLSQRWRERGFLPSVREGRKIIRVDPVDPVKRIFSDGRGTFGGGCCPNRMKQATDKESADLAVEQAWVRACQGGDRAAFDRLVLKYQDTVYGLCYRFLGEEQEALDSSQEAFLKAYRGMPRFRAESRFSTWLFRIAVNQCLNRVKSAEYRRRRKTSSLPGPEEGENPALKLGDIGASPLLQLERRERSRLIQEAIRRLPGDQRSVVLLRDVEGLSYEEIAGVTGCELGTVKSRLARGRAELREKLRRVI